MDNDPPPHSRLVSVQRLSGGPFERGKALGRLGRDAVQHVLTSTPLWAQIQAARHNPAVARMVTITQRHFPTIWAELEGLATGLQLPMERVFAWNCRGELLADTADGCTTVQLPGSSPLIAHNEDGLPCLRGHCFMVEVGPERGQGFTAFCYPGSLPGHTFAFTRQGLVQTVNNLRLAALSPSIPRIVLGRAVLNQPSLADAVALLRRFPDSAGFHFTLAAPATGEMLSVEFGGGEVSVRSVTEPRVHANHALHHRAGQAAQRITQSSFDRQQRGEALLAAGLRDPLALLHDTGGEGLPILRLAPDDPDQENTLATVVFELDPKGLRWRLYEQPEWT
ncbi:6-aminopenicillanic acid acyl-transferase [Vreelandella rituensis]|uniref:6-aminopenicillanic acid acyl-transferase n=1 Tax=Vreelandella rituensis TaxID=2282306 RepID=A0A368TMK0_9GAMM|nr:6-aminopenicillanic acid acyl-transferase [Halomonas rituensis]